MDCVIYKGSKKQDAYLFVVRQDDLSRVPQALLDMLGKLELVMELNLDPERKLAQSDPAEIIGWLETQGYYLQLPPTRPELVVH